MNIRMSSTLLQTAVVFLIASSTLFAQQRDRVIKWVPLGMPNSLSGPGLPLTETDLQAAEVVEFKVSGVPVAPGTPFLAGDDWLNHISVKVRNVTGRPMIYLRLDFGLPEAKYNRNGRVSWPTYWVAYPNPTDHRGVVKIMPGEEVELVFIEKYFAGKFEGIEKETGVKDFTEATVGMVEAAFEDETRWLGSKMCRRANNDRRR